MQVMIKVTNPLAREQTMTKVQDKAKIHAIKELLERDEDFVRTACSGFCTGRARSRDDGSAGG